MLNDNEDFADVEVCQLNGDLIQVVQISRSTTAGDLRKLLAGIRVSSIIVGSRTCGEADMLFEECFDSRVYIKVGEPFSDKESLRSALETIDGSDDVAKRNIIDRHGDVPEWDVSFITDMRRLFEGLSGFNCPIGKWSTAAVTDMSYTFDGASAFNQPIGEWNTAAVTDMSCMFQHASTFNQPIGKWNTAAVTDMSDMFDGAGMSKPGKRRCTLQ